MTTQRKPPRRATLRIQRHTREATDILQRIADTAPQIVERYLDDRDERRPQRGDTHTQRTADDGTNPGPVPQLALADRPDSIQLAWQHLNHALADIRRASQRARLAAAMLLPLDADIANELARKTSPTTADTCIHCGTVVLQNRDDRLRAGRCSACYWWWYRHGQQQDRPLDDPPVSPKSGKQRNRR